MNVKNSRRKSVPNTEPVKRNLNKNGNKLIGSNPKDVRLNTTWALVFAERANEKHIHNSININKIFFEFNKDVTYGSNSKSPQKILLKTCITFNNKRTS